MSPPAMPLPCGSELCPVRRLQPVKDTREKQVRLWTELILKYCRHHKVRHETVCSWGV